MFRRRAEIASLEREMESRHSLGEAEAAELEEVLPLNLLAHRKELDGREEGKASLACLTIHSYMAEWEVKCQRLLSKISAIPAGFTR